MKHTEQRNGNRPTVHHLGTFLRIDPVTQEVAEKGLTALDVISWKEGIHGKAEFKPSGDCPAVQLIFSDKLLVCPEELIALNELLQRLGGEPEANLLRVYYILRVTGGLISTLTANMIRNRNISVFLGDNLPQLHHRAALALFRRYFGDLYSAWMENPCVGFEFDATKFLASSSWITEEIQLGERMGFLVSPQPVRTAAGDRWADYHTTSVMNAVSEVLNYCWDGVKEDSEKNQTSDNHVYRSMELLAEWLDPIA